MDKGEESRCELVITRGHPAELLELEEEGLHKMAFLVEPPIDLPRVRVISFWRDTEIRITARDKLPQRLFAISLIRENGCAFQVNSAEQFFSYCDIVHIACGQHDLDRVAKSVHDGVNLRASAAAAHSNALIGLRLVLTISNLLGDGIFTIYRF